jgi:hypothetical protein
MHGLQWHGEFLSDVLLTCEVCKLSALRSYWLTRELLMSSFKRGHYIMTKTLLASAAMIFAVSTASFAVAPVTDTKAGFNAKIQINDMEAKRSKPRVPGGSGCNTPRDIAEHPECTPAAKRADGKAFEGINLMQEAKRSKPRVPGGSGCNTPKDVAEHPECRA